MGAGKHKVSKFCSMLEGSFGRKEKEERRVLGARFNTMGKAGFSEMVKYGGRGKILDRVQGHSVCCV